MFESLVYDLVVASPRPVMTVLEPDRVELAFSSGARALILRYAAGEAKRLVDCARAAIKSGVAEVVLVGGPKEARQLLAKAQPFFTANAVTSYHLPDQGPLWRSRRRLVLPPVGRALRRGLQGPPDEASGRRLVEDLAREQRTARLEAMEFAQGAAARAPVATMTLAVAMIAMFVLEVALGGSEYTPALVRLGALVPALVPREPWRLFSSAFLHAGLLHLVLNTYVLVVLGGALERVLGSWRFLVVFSFAVLGGSLASLLAGTAVVTVGASGGLWGLLVAETVLVCWPRGLVPRALIPGARRAALTSLVINLANSTRPEISLSAHLGGGLVGASLMLSGLLIRGLPKLGELSPGAAPKRDLQPVWLRPLALGGSALLAASLVAALALGGGLLLRAPLKLTAVAVGETGITVQFPAGLVGGPVKEARSDAGTMQTLSRGELLRDPAIYAIRVFELARPIAAEAMPGELEGLLPAAGKAERGFVAVRPPVARRIGGHDAVLVTFDQEAPGRLSLERVMYLSPTRLVTIEVLYWQDRFELRGSAERTLASLVEQRTLVSQAESLGTGVAPPVVVAAVAGEPDGQRVPSRRGLRFPARSRRERRSGWRPAAL